MRLVVTHRHGTFHLEGDEGQIHAHDDCLGFTDSFVNVAFGHLYCGPHVFFARNCRILTTSHDYTKFGRERIESTYTARNCDIVLDEGVWVCDSAILIGPCRIGKHSVVSAGAVVTGTFPAYSLIHGNPGHFVQDIRERATDPKPCPICSRPI